jgi:hypothetical protein
MKPISWWTNSKLIYYLTVMIHLQVPPNLVAILQYNKVKEKKKKMLPRSKLINFNIEEGSTRILSCSRIQKLNHNLIPLIFWLLLGAQLEKEKSTLGPPCIKTTFNTQRLVSIWPTEAWRDVTHPWLMSWLETLVIFLVVWVFFQDDKPFKDGR